MQSSWGVRTTARAGRRVVDVLDRAFADDPWLSWTLPDAGARRSLISLFLRTVGVPHGRLLVAGDPLVAAAVLLPPGVVVPERPEVGEVVLSLHGRRAGPALDGDAVLEHHRQDEPGWVLHTLGVDPDHQGVGIGSALLDGCLDLSGGQLSLETSSRGARDFYLRRGFVLHAEVVLPAHGLGEDAPTVWMLATPPPAPG